MRASALPLQYFENISEGLAAELNLLNAVCGTDGYGVLIWHADQSLVVPAAFARKLHFHEAAENSARRGWPVELRPTGGGTTPQGHGILNVAIAFRSTSRASIRDAYQNICNPLRNAFAELGFDTTYQSVPGSFCDGEFNVALKQRKLAGTAQRWRRAHNNDGFGILAHALILHSNNITAATQAISEFHGDLDLNAPVVPTAHTSLALEGCEIGQVDFSRLILRHVECQMKDLTPEILPGNLGSEVGVYPENSVFQHRIG